MNSTKITCDLCGKEILPDSDGVRRYFLQCEPINWAWVASWVEKDHHPDADHDASLCSEGCLMRSLGAFALKANMARAAALKANGAEHHRADEEAPTLEEMVER